jgi:hypothetical protein
MPDAGAFADLVPQASRSTPPPPVAASAGAFSDLVPRRAAAARPSAAPNPQAGPAPPARARQGHDWPPALKALGMLQWAAESPVARGLDATVNAPLRMTEGLGVADNPVEGVKRGFRNVLHPAQATEETHNLERARHLPVWEEPKNPGEAAAADMPITLPGPYPMTAPLAAFRRLGQLGEDMAVETFYDPITYAPGADVVSVGKRALGYLGKVPSVLRAAKAIKESKPVDRLLSGVVEGHDLRKSVTRSGEDIVKGHEGAAANWRHRTEQEYAKLIERNRAVLDQIQTEREGIRQRAESLTELEKGLDPESKAILRKRLEPQRAAIAKEYAATTAQVPAEIRTALLQRAYREGTPEVRRQALKKGYRPTAQEQAAPALNILHGLNDEYEPTQRLFDKETLAATAGPIHYVRQGKTATFDLRKMGGVPDDPLADRLLDRLVRGARIEAYHGSRRNILRDLGLTLPGVTNVPRTMGRISAAQAAGDAKRLQRYENVLSAQNEAAKSAEAARAANLKPGAPMETQTLEYLDPVTARARALRDAKLAGASLPKGVGPRAPVVDTRVMQGQISGRRRALVDAEQLAKIARRAQEKTGKAAGAAFGQVREAAGHGERVGEQAANLQEALLANRARAGEMGEESKALRDLSATQETAIAQLAKTPSERAVANQARLMRDEANASSHATDIDARLGQIGSAAKAVSPDWVWTNGKWRMAGEFADIPERYLNKANKPKFPPTQMGEGNVAARVHGNVDDVASQLGMSDDELRSALSNRQPKATVADYLEAARQRIEGDILAGHTDVLQRLGLEGYDAASAIEHLRAEGPSLQRMAQRLDQQSVGRLQAARDIGPAASTAVSGMENVKRAIGKLTEGAPKAEAAVTEPSKVASAAVRARLAKTSNLASQTVTRLAKARDHNDVIAAMRGMGEDMAKVANEVGVPKTLQDRLFGAQGVYQDSLLAQFSDLQRDALFVLPFAHKKNISILAALGPGGLKTLARGIRYSSELAAEPARYADRIKELEASGATQHWLRDVQPTYAKIPKVGRAIADFAERGNASLDRYDLGMRLALQDELNERGITGFQAAGLIRDVLGDYKNQAPLIRELRSRLGANFPGWRLGVVPRAMGKALLEQPRAVHAYARAQRLGNDDVAFPSTGEDLDAAGPMEDYASMLIPNPALSNFYTASSTIGPLRSAIDFAVAAGKGQTGPVIQREALRVAPFGSAVGAAAGIPYPQKAPAAARAAASVFGSYFKNRPDLRARAAQLEAKGISGAALIEQLRWEGLLPHGGSP